MSTYRKEQFIKNTLHQRKLLKKLPYFITIYFRSLENISAPTTRLAYANDLIIFFNYLINNLEEFKNLSIDEFTTDHLNSVTIDHLENYIDYISLYFKFSSTGECKQLTNKNTGKSRKISSIRTMFKYHYKRQLISSNPAELLLLPKLHDKAIVRLEPNEVAKLLDAVESGSHLTKSQKAFHYITSKRDFALISLLLGTGMRVSECVGIDIKHINFDNNSILITRKGGDKTILYFGKEVEMALLLYLKDRNKITSRDNSDALFLSIQNKRLGVRSIQYLVKKYSNNVIKLKNITPHKLRSTYGTNLYNNSGDIYLVADALGHKDVNTTKKHYATIEDEKRKSAPSYITLREE